ncbi:MAG: glutamate 5-kinase, partial [Xanthomonadales bacterium]|nr:glutamate 5-kinase [Xanthomonadales bacterium]MCB1643532.1 glutamate 5-kinase [Xanthomonadales bacterium]
MSAPLVLKVGTSTLTGGSGRLQSERMQALVDLALQLRQQDRPVVLVSSGAVAAGREALAQTGVAADWQKLAGQVPVKQMLAAVGQPLLLARFQQAAAAQGASVAQILLSRSDLERRGSWLNARNTLRALLDAGLLPIVNENDSVATEELRFGDNDRLSALVATLVDARQLVLLTDQDGLYDAHPGKVAEARLVLEVAGPVSAELRAAAGGTEGQGTGGMASKLQAADLARRAGIEVLICHGARLERLPTLLQGQPERGTVLRALGDRLEARKRFLLGALDAGSIEVDAGAEQALRQGRSLLPVGVRGCQGEFGRGDLLRIIDQQGQDLARGVVNYGAADLRRIAGRRSEEIEALLGYHYGDVVVHRNDLVVL